MTVSLVPQLRESLTRLLDVSQQSLDGFKVPAGLRFQVLGGIVAAECEHVNAIVELSRPLSERSAEVLLRSVIEGWIAASYVMQVENDERAKRYLMKRLTEARKFLRRIQKLAEEHEDRKEEILRSAGPASMDDCKQRLGSVEEGISKARDTGLKEIPPLATCAEKLGLMHEWIYASVYGLLLSDVAHVGPAASFEFLGEDTLGDREGLLKKVLWTTLTTFLELLYVASDHLGAPPKEQLAPFSQFLDAARLDAAAST